MRKYHRIAVKEIRLTELTCSACGLDLLANELELQEALRYDDVGGFTSVFGDGSRIYIDLCQHCVKRLLGEYLTIE